MVKREKIIEKIPRDIRGLIERRNGEIIIEGSDTGGWMSPGHQPGEYTVTARYRHRNGRIKERKLYINI